MLSAYSTYARRGYPMLVEVSAGTRCAQPHWRSVHAIDVQTAPCIYSTLKRCF